MKILTFSTLFPNAESPGHGIFVETRLRHLLENFSRVSTKVSGACSVVSIQVRSVWRYGKFARVTNRETRHGISDRASAVLTYALKIGMTSAPYLLAKASLPVLRKIIRDGFRFRPHRCSLLFSRWCRCCNAGKELNKPVVVTARGSDHQSDS